jgi:hypothetical protein
MSEGDSGENRNRKARDLNRGLLKTRQLRSKIRCSSPATQPSGFARSNRTTTLRNWARNHEQILSEKIANEK